MGRRKMGDYNYIGSVAPYACDFGCGASLADKFKPEARQWIWFSGYGDRPAHFCPACLKTRRQEVEAIRDKLNQRPEGYPRPMLDTSAVLSGFRVP